MMDAWKRIVGAAGAAVFVAAAGVAAQHHGHCRHHDCPGAATQDGRGVAADMQVFHQLFASRETIRRSVQDLPDGIVTVTESTDPAVVQLLQTHVSAMVARMETGRPIHARDPLFAEIFRQASAVKVRVEPLPSGVRVTETSDDAYVVKLLREHARVVGLFIENGMSEMRRDHAVPAR